MVPVRPPPTLEDPKRWSPELNDFIKQCLVKDPQARPRVVDLLTHPFVQQAVTLSPKYVLANLITDFRQKKAELSTATDISETTTTTVTSYATSEPSEFAESSRDTQCDDPLLSYSCESEGRTTEADPNYNLSRAVPTLPFSTVVVNEGNDHEKGEVQQVLEQRAAVEDHTVEKKEC